MTVRTGATPMLCSRKALCYVSIIFLLFAATSSPLVFAAENAADKKIVVTIVGVEDRIKENVLAHLSLGAFAVKKEPVSNEQVARLFKRADQEIRSAIRAYGYYEAELKTDLREEKKWLLEIAIAPGRQTTLRKADIRLTGGGREEKSLQALQQGSGLQTGAGLSHQAYSDFKSALQSQAYELGYLDAQFTTHTMRVYQELHKADIELHFDTGSRYFFGPISIEQSILNPEFVQRFVKPMPGEPFESSRLVQMQLALTETNYFDQVGVEVQRDSAEQHHIPIAVTASSRKASKYDFSAGFGTDTGPRIGAKVDFSRVNRRGHRLSNQLQLSAVQSSLVSQYLIPIGDVTTDFLDFTGNIEKEEINDVETTQYRLGTSLNENRWGGRRRLGLDYAYETWSFGDEPSNSAGLLIPSIDYTLKKTDDDFFPLRGYSLTSRILGAAESILSDVSFVQVQLFGRAVLPISDRSRLLVRAELGATETDDFDGLPPSLRFFTGGSQSVRGYGYNDLSPTDSFGNRIGGKYLTVMSAEVDYLFHENIGLAAFVDGGNATESPFSNLNIGAGVGFRYRSPVGMLRFDIAHPFDDPDNSFRIHISFGTDL